MWGSAGAVKRGARGTAHRRKRVPLGVALIRRVRMRATISAKKVGKACAVPRGLGVRSKVSEVSEVSEEVVGADKRMGIHWG